jgi:hypothetical protein
MSYMMSKQNHVLVLLFVLKLCSQALVRQNQGIHALRPAHSVSVGPPLSTTR